MMPETSIPKVMGHPISDMGEEQYFLEKNKHIH